MLPNDIRAIRWKNKQGDPLDNLELLSAAYILAPQLYTARAEAFGVSGMWKLLNAGERQHYIDLCLELLRDVEPERGQVVSFPPNGAA